MSCGDAQSGGHAECSTSLPNDNSKFKMSRLDQDLSAKPVAIESWGEGHARVSRWKGCQQGRQAAEIPKALTRPIMREVTG